MTQHFHREIEDLKRNLLDLGDGVVAAVHEAVEAVSLRDAERAETVIAGDPAIDRREVKLEEECLKLLALHQPVAIDLRFLVAVIKINNDLERIGDLAVNIAERASFLARRPAVDVPFDFPGMSMKTQAMLRRSLDSLVNLDATIARRVCAADDEIDAINATMYGQVQEGIRRHPEHLESLIHLLAVSRHLERIADHATNIAEDVIYMVEGEIVRHRTEEYHTEGAKGRRGPILKIAPAGKD